MRLKFAFLCITVALLVPIVAFAQSLGIFRISSASVNCAGAGAAALAVRFSSITLRADPSNAGAVCIGGSTVTCQVGIATAATDGIKLMPGDAVTIQGGQWPSGTLYLNNTSANDYVSYMALD